MRTDAGRPTNLAAAERACAQTRGATDLASALVDAEPDWLPPPAHPAASAQHEEAARIVRRLTEALDLTV